MLVTKDNFMQLPGTWKLYRKKVLTHFIKVEGPFEVETSEGRLRCEDGYVGIDARGYPYPVAEEEHALIYKEVEKL